MRVVNTLEDVVPCWGRHLVVEPGFSDHDDLREVLFDGSVNVDKFLVDALHVHSA